MVKVKICGITNSEDAAAACSNGADFIGFIFVEGTPRAVVKDTVKDIMTSLNEKGVIGIGKVGLFKDKAVETVSETIVFTGLDFVQLHGKESPAYCNELKKNVLEKTGKTIKVIKTFKVSDEIIKHDAFDISHYVDADYFLFDTFSANLDGGTGTGFEWDILTRNRDKIIKPFFLAGGLNLENVAEAIKKVKPYGVDVSSGVEITPGKKDGKLLKEFIKNAKST